MQVYIKYQQIQVSEVSSAEKIIELRQEQQRRRRKRREIGAGRAVELAGLGEYFIVLSQ